MARRQINLLELLARAWQTQQTLSKSKLHEGIRNLISHAYSEIGFYWRKDCAKNGDVYGNEETYLLQRLLVFVIIADQKIYKEEYEAYCKCCEVLRLEPLNQEQFETFSNTLTIDFLVADAIVIKHYREKIDPDKYEAFILGFCMLPWLADKTIFEEEYLVLSTLLDENYDYVPSWEEFKRLW